jgi:hypothetical protein
MIHDTPAGGNRRDKENGEFAADEYTTTGFTLMIISTGSALPLREISICTIRKLRSPTIPEHGLPVARRITTRAMAVIAEKIISRMSLGAVGRGSICVTPAVWDCSEPAMSSGKIMTCAFWGQMVNSINPV